MKRAVSILSAGALLTPSVAFAQISDLGVPPFGSIISQLYDKSLQLVGLAVFIMFLIAGMSYILPDRIKPAFMKDPVTIMIDAVIGTILLFAAYLILNTINPSLTELPLRSPAVQSNTSGGGASLPTGSATTPTPSTFEGQGGSFGGGGATSDF